MKVKIQEEIKSIYSPIIGVIYARDIDNSKEIKEIDNLFKKESEKLRNLFSQYEAVSQHPNIKAWREVYKKFGTDPKRYRCSIEALVRRVIKGDEIPRINTLVDLYNYISIRYVLPVGGEDIDKIEGDVELALSDGTEEFVMIGSSDNDPPKEGEVIYKDEKGVLCRRWNWREAGRTKLTKDTRNAIIVIDAVGPTTKEEVEKATNELADLIKKYCGGNIEIKIHDSK